jgi:hypothetical protein
MTSMIRVSIVAFGVAASVVSGCSAKTGTGAVDADKPTATGERPAATSETANSQCRSVGTPLTDIAPLSVGEPRMRIPLPEGWVPTSEMNSEMVRFVAANAGLSSDAFAPTVVVTLEKVPSATTAEDEFERQQQALVAQDGATGVTASKGSVCGLPAVTLEYTTGPTGGGKPHPATVLMTYLPGGETSYVSTTTLQTMDPKNSTYQHDSAEILDGFQMLAPK